MKIDKTILGMAIDKWGTSSQVGMLHEECLELALALHKLNSRAGGRGQNNTLLLGNVYDELADVIIMVEQSKLIFNMNKVQERIDYKMNRLNERLNK